MYSFKERMIPLSKKSLYQLYEDLDLSEENHKLYKTMKDIILLNMYKHILTTLKNDAFKYDYDNLLPPSRLLKDRNDQPTFKFGIGKERNNIVSKLILIPMIKKNKTYILTEMTVINQKDGQSFKETHQIPFPIKYLDFTNQEFDFNYLAHESKVRESIFNNIMKPYYKTPFKENNAIIRELATSFKDVFI